MDRSVEDDEEKKDIELQENPVPMMLQPTRVYNKYQIYDSPSWHYVHKVNCFLFCFGLVLGYLLGSLFPPKPFR